jgi:hypothetical protein
MRESSSRRRPAVGNGQEGVMADKVQGAVIQGRLSKQIGDEEIT